MVFFMFYHGMFFQIRALLNEMENSLKSRTERDEEAVLKIWPVVSKETEHVCRCNIPSDIDEHMFGAGHFITKYFRTTV